jgi:hypothetical protein
MPAPQNWQAVSEGLPGIFRDDTPKGIEGIPGAP